MSSKKEAGIDLVVSNNVDFVHSMRVAAKRIARRTGSVSVDDLRRISTKRGLAPRHQNCWGGIFRGTEWRVSGWTQSRFPSNNGRRICVWELR